MTEPLRVAFVGAGGANFGGGEGPWDHASRLEQFDGLVVVGVADPDTDAARRKLSERNHPMFSGARVFDNTRAMLEATRPEAVWIAVPPDAHGTVEPPRDIELACLEAGTHLFIEKPLSAFRPEVVYPVARAVAESDRVVSVGYMFRYSAAVARMKAILDETPGPPRAFIARYDCAYSEIRKHAWWDVRKCGGPIVEQATHFVDLGRYLCGDVVPDSVTGVSIGADEAAGHLVDIPTDPDGAPYDADVPHEYKPPRATAAVWRHTGGALGNLVHGVLLHGEAYSAGLEVWADGLRMELLDPYGDCRLVVRRPHGEEVTEERFDGDDPYLEENRAFLHAIRSGDTTSIRSPYLDAMKSFELTWTITDRSR